MVVLVVAMHAWAPPEPAAAGPADEPRVQRYVERRVLDLSAAAPALGVGGVAPVSAESVSGP